MVKVSGLAAGKGVLVANTRQEAFEEAKALLFDGKFGSAAEEVIVEERLDGEEVSVRGYKSSLLLFLIFYKVIRMR